jgi:membrane protein DedA with SNARE-associated domain/rhodanese-related sulfurtransferase
MNGTMELLTTYGYSAVFACVLAEQLGLPLPATPILLAAGALSGLGRLNLLGVWLLAILASLLGDTAWYYLGKTRGIPVLRLLCKISLEPGACVRKTASTYSRYGARWLLFAKFIPGVSTIAPPMAGAYGVSSWWFLIMDGIGAGVWTGVFIFAGSCFHGQADAVAAYLGRLGAWLGFALAGLAATCVLLKLIERRRLHRSLGATRIGPLELKQRMDSGATMVIVDLRNSWEQQREGRIPGSLAFSEEELEAFVPAIPETEMIVYCSCPDEISSAARTAIRLKRAGVRWIRPLEGGFPLWKRMGLPVEVQPNAISEALA